MAQKPAAVEPSPSNDLREKMRQDRAKAAAAARKRKHSPAFEVVDVSEKEKALGQKVDEYKRKKELEAIAKAPASQPSSMASEEAS